MRVYYDRDADLSRIMDKKIAIVGYGCQGHAHALNLRDCGVKNVAVALRPGSATAKKAEGEGLKVMTVAEAAKWADVVMMLAPDELQRDIYNDEIARQHQATARRCCSPTASTSTSTSSSRQADLDVLMVAPKGPGHTVRGEYQKGGGVPCLIAIHQDAIGQRA